MIDPELASAASETSGAPGGSPAFVGAALAWYCARTKPRHDHIAAANLRRNLGLEVFSPRLRLEQTTIRGVVKNITEPVFPGYVFVRCAIDLHLDSIRHTSGVNGLVNFGGRVSEVHPGVVADLRECFGLEEILDLHQDPVPGESVTMAGGAFLGMQAVVLRALPARRRVQVLLEILGRPTPLEVDRRMVTLHRTSVAASLPVLAAPAFA